MNKNIDWQTYINNYEDLQTQVLILKKKHGHIGLIHDIKTKKRYYIKSTNYNVIAGAYNNNIDQTIIQLNHYKTKTLLEFQYIRSRGQTDIKPPRLEDLVACNFYKNVLNQIRINDIKKVKEIL